MHGTPNARVCQTGWLNWRAALLLGLASSTYSTLVSQMAAGRLGRDPWVDWMSVAAIPARDWALQFDPGWAAIAAGIAFHQWADFSWALVFFGVFGRWTAPRTTTDPYDRSFLGDADVRDRMGLPRPRLSVLAADLHAASALLGWLYRARDVGIDISLFPFIRDWLGGFHSEHNKRFAYDWTNAVPAGLLVLGTLAFLGNHGREVAWLGRDVAYD